MEEKFTAFMPITKDNSGNLVGILSDTSIDRDGEFMTKELLASWAENMTLKALANHENKMEKWVGGWKDLKLISKGKHTALMATPWFFSKEANPLAEQVRLQIDESLKHGENAGISIGAIPKAHIEKEIDGTKRKGYTEAEIVEATWVPIQSNRHSFATIARSFGLDCIESKSVDDSIEADKQTEDIVKMVDEIKPEPAVEEPKVEAPKVAEPVVETPSEPVKEAEEAPKAEEKDKEIELLKSKNKELEKQLEDRKGILKAKVEAPVKEAPQISSEPLTIGKILNYGGK